MNLFVLDSDPVLAAIDACDQHVVKMTLETAQMLSTVASLRGIKTKYKPTHQNHPCTRWVGLSQKNFLWTFRHGIALAEEYTFRYGKIHKSKEVIQSLLNVAELLPASPKISPFVQAMPVEFQGPNAVEAYRKFYREDKKSFARWNKTRNKPGWM
jgi:hypothetical protein